MKKFIAKILIGISVLTLIPITSTKATDYADQFKENGWTFSPDIESGKKSWYDIGQSYTRLNLGLSEKGKPVYLSSNSVYGNPNTILIYDESMIGKSTENVNSNYFTNEQLKSILKVIVDSGAVEGNKDGLAIGELKALDGIGSEKTINSFIGKTISNYGENLVVDDYNAAYYLRDGIALCLLDRAETEDDLIELGNYFESVKSDDWYWKSALLDDDYRTKGLGLSKYITAKIAEISNKDTANDQLASIDSIQKMDFDKLSDNEKAFKALIIAEAVTSDGFSETEDFNKKAMKYFEDIDKVKIEFLKESEDIGTGDNKNARVLVNNVLSWAKTQDPIGKESTMFQRCYALACTRGSRYREVLMDSYKKDLNSVKASLQKSSGSDEFDKQARRYDGDVKKLKDIYKAKDTDLLFLTMKERLHYAYALTLSENKDNKTAELETASICMTPMEKDTLYKIQENPINLKGVSVQNFEGFVYMNDLTIDLERLADKHVKSLVDARSYESSTAALTYLQNAFLMVKDLEGLDGISKDENYSDEDKKNFCVDNDLAPIKNVWNNYVIDTGSEINTLAKLYTYLTEHGVDFSKIAKNQLNSKGNPLYKYVDMNSGALNDSIRAGIALSATYIPFKTNVYNPVTYTPVQNDKDFFGFHAMYGYNRKALYIDTNTSAASELHTTDKRGGKKLATLKDILQCEKDIVIYIDDNFYNVNKLQAYKDEGIKRLDNGDKTKATTDTNGVVDTIKESIWDLATTDIIDVTKTAENTSYVRSLTNIKSYEETKDPKYKGGGEEDTVLAGPAIDKLINMDITNETDLNYNVMRAFAFTSLVYRDKNIFNTLESDGVKPVFISSKNLAVKDGIEPKWAQTYYNYSLLKNIENNMTINYKSELDEDKPIYMDIYGNILTESGAVVIPAAANATLQANDYNPYSAAFISTYGNNFRIPADVKLPGQGSMAKYMELNKDKTAWVFRDISFNGVVDLNSLSTANTQVSSELYKLYSETVNQAGFDNKRYINQIFFEVMRGAPLDAIDKNFEGLMVGIRTTKNGIKQAAKLDNLKTSLSTVGQNAVLALPNLAFMEGLEYVIFLTYKIALVLALAMLVFLIFRAGMTQGFNIMTILKMFATIALTITAIFVIPTIFDFSYYQSNKFMLQNETMQIAMLNLEKKDAGVEIGITDTGSPDIKSKLFLKMKDVDIPWYKGFRDIISSNITAKMKDIYDKYAADDLAYSGEDFEFKDGALYEDVQKLFDSSSIALNLNYSTLYPLAEKNTPASFYSPYYAFLHVLTVNANVYNTEHGVYNYSTQVYAGGKVKSVGLIKDYYTSDTFISTNDSTKLANTRDILHLEEIYSLAKERPQIDRAFSEEEINAMQRSKWCNALRDENNPSNGGTLKPEQLNSRIEKLDLRAKLFVARNKDLLGRISDETFLKAMALDLACYHNSLFNTDSADSLEIYNVSADDITRLSIADRGTVIKGSPLSYTRFVFETAGEVGVYAAAILEVVNFLVGWIKPIVTILLFLAIFFSLFIYNIVMQSRTNSYRGYIIIVGALVSTNLIYSLCLKISMYLPRIHCPPAVCLLIQVILQIIVCIIFIQLAFVAIYNWKDLGAASFESFGTNMMIKLKETAGNARRNLPQFNNRFGNKLYDKLLRNDRARNRYGRDYGSDYDYVGTGHRFSLFRHRGRRDSRGHDRREDEYRRMQDYYNPNNRDNYFNGGSEAEHLRRRNEEELRRREQMEAERNNRKWSNKKGHRSYRDFVDDDRED